MIRQVARRTTAAVCSVGLAVGCLVVGGAGVATAEPVTASATYSGAFASSFRIDRTVSEASPTYGDQVTVRTNVQRTSNLDLLYGVRSDVPSCFERVAGTTRGQASGGALITESNSQFSFSGNRAAWSGSGVGPWFWMETDYRVLCGAGSVLTGGAEFASVAGSYRGSMSLGPTVTVQRKATATSINQPQSVVIGQSTNLNATTDAPDGTTLEFIVDGSVVGSAPASGGAAAFSWTAGAPGSYEVQARTVETNTHGASSSSVVSAEVVKSDSTVSVGAASPAMAGSAVPLTATTTGIPDGEPVEFLVGGQSLGTADVDDGSATYTSWTPATAGDYTVQARYGGSATVAGSQSQQVGVTVIDPIQQTSTTLTADPTPVPGRPSTLTATVENGNDGDTVEFSNYGTVVGTGAVEDGVATFSWTPSTGQAGQPYRLTADYLGSGGYAASSSDPVSGTVGLVQTSASVVGAPATATVGEQLTLSASIAGGAAGQTIEFRDGDTILAAVTLPSSGVATAFWTPDATGEYNVTAHYPGTATTNPASSPTATTISVQARESAIELAAPSPVTVGQTSSLTAHTTGVPDGQSISFTVNGTEVDTAQVAGAQASIQWTPAVTGEYELRAEYAGSNDVGASQSNPVLVVVTSVETATSVVTASSNPVTGAAVTLTATVTGGTQGADVEFREGTTVLCNSQVGADGTAACSWTPGEIGDVAVTAHYPGNDTTSASESPASTTVQVGQGTVAAPTGLIATPAAPTTADVVTVSGQAPAGSRVYVYVDGGEECTVISGADGSFSCDLATLPVGGNQIKTVAELNGVPSQIVTLDVTVGMASSTMALSGPASVQPGQPAVLDLTTSGIADGQTVDILVDGDVVGQATVTGGAATYSWTPTETGEFEIRAGYAGSGTVSPVQSDALTITVDETATQISRVTAPTGATIGQPVTLTASVNGGAEGIGVVFRDGTTELCTGQLAADGTASCDWTPAVVGTVTVRAHYPGDATTGASQSVNATSISVGKTVSTVDLQATSPVEVGGSVTFTIITTGIADGQTVDIAVDGTVIGSPTVSAGQATFAWTAPATTGDLTATAAYAGTDTVAGSESDSETIEVGLAATSTSGVAASSGATAGEPVQLSATVTGGTQGVAVEFREGTTVLCTGQLATDGAVNCEWTPAAAGTVAVIAHYLGDDATGSSQSGAATSVTVAAAPDTEAPGAPIGISIAPQPATAGQTVTVTGSAEADSTVAVLVDGVEVCETTATGGMFMCAFDVAEAMDGHQVTVTATDEAGNTSGAAAGGELQVEPEAVDPTEPTITLTPVQPVAGQTVEIEVAGDAGEEVVIVSGGTEICRVTLNQDGTATCGWTPAAEGQTVLEVTVGDQTVTTAVTVRPVPGSGDDDDDDGSLDMGSLGGLFGGAGGSSGSSGSLSSLGG